MALIKPGGIVGQISGRVGGDVYSSNRYGRYVRNGSIPITSTTTEAINAKGRLATVSQAWQGLTAAQRAAWASWAQTNPVVNRLGDSVVLTGHAAFVKCNTVLYYLGAAQIDDPPLSTAPVPLVTLTQSCDIGAGTFDLTYTATPLAADEYLYIRTAVVDSHAINYVQNLLKLVGVSAAAQASPFDHQTLVEGRFGTLQVGQRVHTEVSVVSDDTGLVSAPLKAVTTVVST